MKNLVLTLVLAEMTCASGRAAERFVNAIAGARPPASAAGTYSRVPQAYFHEARHAYRHAADANGTSVVRRYSREDPLGIDAKYDWPDPDRARIPDEPIVWGVKGLRNVRDIGGRDQGRHGLPGQPALPCRGRAGRHRP